VQYAAWQRAGEWTPGLTLATRQEVTKDYGHKNNDSIYKNYKMNA